MQVFGQWRKKRKPTQTDRTNSANHLDLTDLTESTVYDTIIKILSLTYLALSLFYYRMGPPHATNTTPYAPALCKISTGGCSWRSQRTAVPSMDSTTLCLDHSTYLFQVALYHGDCPVSCVQTGVRAHVCAPSLCVSPAGRCPGPGLDSSHSFSLCLCPCLGLAPASQGSGSPGLSHHPQAWPKGEGICAGGPLSHLWLHGPPGPHARCAPWWSGDPVGPPEGAAEGAAGCCCPLLRPEPASSCSEELQSRSCATGPGQQTGTPEGDSRRVSSWVQHSATCWDENTHHWTAHITPLRQVMAHRPDQL